MINLAPNHKTGLVLDNPLMVASGFASYGQAKLFDVSQFGAIVTNPITLRPSSGSPAPRVAETTGGFVLNTGQHNPGVKRVIKQAQKVWARLACPVIAHLPVDEPENLARTARALAGLVTPRQDPLIAAIEFGLPSAFTPEQAAVWIGAIQADCDLPLLLKIPLAEVDLGVEVAQQTGVDALVIGTPPLGAAVSPTGEVVQGMLYGGGVHSLLLRAIQQASQLTDLPLVAVGGVHTPADVKSCLSLGATAVQLDTILFVEPLSVGRWFFAA